MAYRIWALIAFSSLCLAGCAAPDRASIPAPMTSTGFEFDSTPMSPALPATSREETPRFAQSGIASWYREIGRFKRTANGEKPEPMRFTAAHRSLPFGTIVRVMSLRSGRAVLVRINDRGPYAHRRIIDLSYAAAASLGILHDGVAQVSLTVYDSDQCAADAASFLCVEKTMAADAVRDRKRAISGRSTKSLSARSGDRTRDNPTARN